MKFKALDDFCGEPNLLTKLVCSAKGHKVLKGKAILKATKEWVDDYWCTRCERFLEETK